MRFETKGVKKGRAVMKNDVVRARVDSELKANAVRVLASCDLELGDAIRIFLQQVVAHQGLPFAVPAAVAEPSMAQLQLQKGRSQVRDRRIAGSMDVSKGEMLLVKPERLRNAKIRWPKASLV